ncbi:MAG: ISAs1 family transposase, partial [Gallionella sp.]
MSLNIQEAFGSLKDPRVERHKWHKLLDIIVLSICAVISGAEGWEGIAQFGKEKQDWLRRWIDLENGIPSHDCIARVISRLKPDEMQACFVAWTQNFAALGAGEVVAIDGKTARHSYNQAAKLGAIHMVSAWATQA